MAKGNRKGVEEMKLPRLEPLTYFEIYSPRWHDKTVLLKASKIRDAKTKYLKIKFTKAPSMEGDWVISRQKAISFPLTTNGTIQCRAIPLKELEPLTLINDIREII